MPEREVILLNVGTENDAGALVGGMLVGRAVKAYAIRPGDRLTGGTVDRVTKFDQLVSDSPSRMRPQTRPVIMAFDEWDRMLGQWSPDTLVVLEVAD